MGKNSGKGGGKVGFGGAVSKKDIPRWLGTVARNDAKYGRDSKANPNNKRNGKW
jgi:hypothetical protein